MFKKAMIAGLALILVFLSLNGCTSGPLTTREKGTGIGAIGGAAVGGILGATVGHPGAGAAIGGALGLGAGAVIGDQIQDRERLERENNCLKNLRHGANPDLCKQR